VAYASGFQSLRRFNAVVRERCGTTPGRIRAGVAFGTDTPAQLTLELPHRGSFDWETLLARLRPWSLPGVESVTAATYGSTVRLDGRTGAFVARYDQAARKLIVEVSAGLAPVLVPLVARIRGLFDLDADVDAIDRDLQSGTQGGWLGPGGGIRIPGTFDGFGLAVTAIVSEMTTTGREGRALLARIPPALGTPIATGVPGLSWLKPTAGAVARAGPSALERTGLPTAVARAVHGLADSVAAGRIQFVRGADPHELIRRLGPFLEDEGRRAEVVARTVGWPDTFAASDPVLQRAAGANARQLRCLAEGWRPWRAYAAERLRARWVRSSAAMSA
jgi:AraC family transcriptional regulator of adaptative response / DNA-3-methyladenine glycosylase II